MAASAPAYASHTNQRWRCRVRKGFEVKISRIADNSTGAGDFSKIIPNFVNLESLFSERFALIFLPGGLHFFYIFFKINKDEERNAC
jgi:hypothetical protein